MPVSETVDKAKKVKDTALFGLSGVWQSIAQFGALGVVLLSFYQDRHSALDQAKEDRALFREELRLLRDSNSKELNALADAQKSNAQRLERAFEKLTLALEKNTKSNN